MSVPDPSTVTGHAYGHAQTARSLVTRAEAFGGSDSAMQNWDKARIYALVSIAESLATLATNQATQIPGDP